MTFETGSSVGGASGEVSRWTSSTGGGSSRGVISNERIARLGKAMRALRAGVEQKGSPVEGLAVVAPRVHQRQLGVAQGGGGVPAGVQTSIQFVHELGGR